MIESLTQLYRPTAKSKGVSLVSESDAEGAVKLDRNKFEQIAGNLLSNALKFTRKGGEVAIRVRNEGNNLILSVKDSGIGMSANQINSLFYDGKIGPAGGTDGEKSTGLGVPIIKHFIELHDGSIDVQSEQGKGAEFIITLPIR